MKGDFTRNTFAASKHFTRVLMQQGRVQLDADWNEQAAILLHYLQALAADLIGPHGGPVDNWGFGISVDDTTLSDEEKTRLMGLDLLPLKSGDFLIGKGDYYVEGMLCENETPTTYTSQLDYPLPENAKLKPPPAAPSYLVYLDVWERHITYIEDDSIREVALGGPDTATRARVLRQVKVLPTDSGQLDQITLAKIQNHTPPYKPEEQHALLTVILPVLTEKLKNTTGAAQRPLRAKIDSFKNALLALNKASLRARALVAQPSTDPCTIQPDARYRGAENQLYRVEIHRGGSAWDKSDNTKANAATFKWSRENGSVVFPIRKLEGKVVTLKHLGRDGRFGLAVGDWVEIVDDDYALQNRAEPLLKVQAIDPVDLQVTLNESPAFKVGQDPGKHPLLRRWDHKAGGLTLDGGAALIVEGKGDTEGWLTLEDSVQIQFQMPAAGEVQNQYRTGDYWLIPARTATGDVEWPGPAENPDAVPPHGVTHHYAPLASISLDPAGKVSTPTDLRRKFDALAK